VQHERRALDHAGVRKAIDTAHGFSFGDWQRSTHMIDFEIDCQTFLRLTDVGLGEYGLYVVETSGVRAKWSKADLDDFAKRMGGGREAEALLDFIRDARLPFSTTAQELLAWQKLNTEFELPDWFAQLLEAADGVAATTIIDSVRNDLVKKIRGLEAKVQALKSEKAKPGVWYPIEAKAERLGSMLLAIDSIRSSICVGSPPTDQPQKRRKSNDLMALEIEQIKRDLGEYTPAMVMKELRAHAGMRGSCVVKICGDGVTWKRLSEEVSDLTMANLRSRLSRNSRRTKN